MIALAFGIVLIEPGGARLEAQQSKPPATSHLPPAFPAPSGVWRSQTTGKEYRVRIENEQLRVEWVNIPAALAQRGAYIRTDCRRVGTKWIGTSRIFLPCPVLLGLKERGGKWCHLQTRTEIDAVTQDRITGHTEGLRRFDCQNCRALETAWREFVWVPKR